MLRGDVADERSSTLAMLQRRRPGDDHDAGDTIPIKLRV